MAINTSNCNAFERDLGMFKPAVPLTYSAEDMELSPLRAEDRCLIKGVPRSFFSRLFELVQAYSQPVGSLQG